ncbi:MAG TPA: hypothetical protein P5338_13050, partial [Bacteroidales bacterium]|nr:hypothetical protein [Bacteroidales bacterium]
QTLLYSENFETNSLPDSIVYTGTGLHGKSTMLFSEGLHSDSMRIDVAGDSVVMTTQAFSTTGSANVMLYFDHICKIEFFDEGYVEVSNNNGVTWTRLTGTQYLGASQFAIQGNKFTAAAYTTDWAAGTFAVPANSWWKNEVFDISLIAANAASVQVRFVLRDAQPGNTMPDNYAWLIDHIRVFGAISELIPPVITINPPVIQDTVYSAGPFAISATITDTSGIDTAMVIYTVNAGIPDTIGMVNTSGSLYTGSIPVQPFNTTICYKIVAIDGSVSHNAGYVPSLGCTSFYTKQAMMGTYTIGGTGANYATFNAAVTALNTSGVSGPVEFLVAPGTYTEQLTLTAVVGMGPVNTVTFRSANNDSTSVTLQFTGTGSTNNWVVRLSGASHFIFRKLTIRALSTSYGRVVEMINGSMYNLFASNRLITAGTSTSTTGCIYDYNTLNHYNTYLNNYMEGGYYTIYIYGVNTTSWQKGTVIQGNEIVGSYYYPMYIYYTDSTQVIGNYIHSGTAAYSYGINCYYINNQYRIVGNRVAVTATSSSACYGIRDYYGNYATYNPTPTGYGLVANNMVSITGGTGTHYGLYAYYCNGTEYYFNSISITGGSTSSRSLYQANTSSNTLGQKFANNIFSNSVGGYSAYFNTPAQVTLSDYNDLYSTSTSTFAYWSGNIASLAALQTASGKEVNSVSIQPPFTSTHDLTLTSTTLSGKGIYVASVPYDIKGYPRSPAPTIGAYEVPLLPKDAGAVSFVTPTSQSVIGESQLIPITVMIVNMGTDSLTSVDVHYRINGGPVVSATYTGLLFQFQTDSIAMPPFISPAGQVQIKAWTTLSGDTNFFNDTAYFTYYGIPLQDAKMRRIIPYADPCGLALETVRVVIENVGSATIPANFSASFKLDNTATVVTHTVPDSIPVNDSIIFSFPTPVNLTATVDTTFKLFAWVTLTGDYVQTNDTTSLDIESKIVPPPPTVTTPVNIPYGAQATLNATSTLPIIWYATDTSTVKLDTGNTFVTPYLFDTTTFWVQAGSALGAPSSLYTGTQSSNYAAAQTRGFHFTAPVDMIITELMVPNTVTAGTQYIQVVKFSGYPVVYPGGSPFTTLATITNAPFNVPQPVNIVIQTGDEIGIIGGSNSSGTTMNMSYGASQVPSSIGGIPVVLTRLVYQSPLVSGPAASGTIGLEVSASIGRIDMKYVVGGTGCPSNRIPVVVNTALPPPVDAGISSVLNPVVNTTSGTPTPITMNLKNFGLDTLFSANIVWSLNNVIQDTFPWTGSLPFNQTLPVTIDTASFAGGSYCIKSWTYLPNGITDSVNSNDTAVSCFNACMAGTYTIGPSATGTYDFNSFNSAVTTLVTSGICGPIVFDVYPGTYTEQVTIPQINGMDINNTITFRGTGDSTQAILEFSASSTANWTLRLDGADYTRFEKLTIRALNATTGRVIELINGAQNNRFAHNQIITVGTSSSTTACIYDYNTLNHYNTYLNNYMNGGYYGMYIYGVSSTSWEKGTVIKGNTIRGTYYYPIYVYYGDSVEVIGNLVDSVVGNYSYGINLYYTNNYYRIVGNTVRITGTSGTSYGIRDYYCNYYSY